MWKDVEQAAERLARSQRLGPHCHASQGGTVELVKFARCTSEVRPRKRRLWDVSHEAALGKRRGHSGKGVRAPFSAPAKGRAGLPGCPSRPGTAGAILPAAGGAACFRLHGARRAAPDENGEERMEGASVSVVGESWATSTSGMAEETGEV